MTHSTRYVICSRLVKTCASLAASIVVLAAWMAATADAANKKAADSRHADQCVAEALQREIYAQDQQRAELLKEALAHKPDCKPALWHSGYVQVNHEWIRVDDVARLAAADKRILRYRNKRDEAPQTVNGQLALADWCATNRLPDQERAHLTRVLELDPEHAQARQRLGFVRVDDTWLTREEVLASRSRAVDANEAFAQWTPKLLDIRRALLEGSRKQREYAQARLHDINDPAAIPALEAAFSTHSEAMALLVLDTLHAMAGSEASISLARHAVFSRYEPVRDAAAARLRDRPYCDFVPALLSAMRMPINTRRELLQGPRGRLLYRHAFYREGQDNREIAVLETEYRRVSLPGGSRRQTLQRALDDVRDRAESREETVQEANQRTAELNQRVMHTLELATRLNVFNTPEMWWTWWNDYNEVYVSAEKEIRGALRKDKVTLVDQTPVSLLPSGPGGLGSGPDGTFGSPGGGTGDCLVAGTLVWTEAGPRAIETIKPGDRVLSQDPETGELTYKPVLGTTVRPPSQLINVNIDDEKISTSGGHLYWVAGDGWVKARHVKTAAQLHSVGGAVTVSFSSTGGQAETYNLVVADFNTYFVGKHKVLCHDNTIRQPTETVIPGLLAE